MMRAPFQPVDDMVIWIDIALVQLLENFAP